LRVDFDITINMNDTKGHPNPLTLVINDIIRIFGEIGFSLAEGPELGLATAPGGADEPGGYRLED